MKDPEAIPDALRERDQWLTWDRATDRKQPYWGAKKVSWSDPDSWHSFAAAREKAAEQDSWGVGYVTAANNDAAPMGIISVIDIDGGADADDRPKEWLPSLQPFIDREAYIEWSQSHDDPGDSGIHIPIIGTPPEWWHDVAREDGEHEGIDVLANKFCVFTGDRLDPNVGDELPTWGEWADEWLADAYEAVTGEPAPMQDEQGGTFMAAEKAGSHDAQGGEEWVDEATAREALTHLSADCAYQQWRNIGFALADHFDERTAKDLFDEWSRGGSKYDREAERLIEDIAGRGSGGVTIGTLVHHAQAAGWEPSFGGEEYEGTPTARELVARHSDEYADVSEVPEDIFERREPREETVEHIDCECGHVAFLWKRTDSEDMAADVADDLEAVEYYGCPECDRMGAVRYHADGSDGPHWEQEPSSVAETLRDKYGTVPEVPDSGVNSAEMAKSQFGDPDAYERDTAETDGGATTASADESGPERDGDSHESDTPASAWENVYAAYVGAEDADERLPARYEATEQLAAETAWRGIVENDSLWTYKPEKGIFEGDGDERVRETLVEHLREQFKAHEVREIAEQLRGRNTVSESSMGGPEGLIAAENCVIDLLEEETREHSPEYDFMSRLGCAFDPDAECPRWRAFLQEVVDSDTDRQKLQEFAGYFLHHWEMPYHKALFLVGPTASGKSTFLDTINAMLGDGTAASLTPQQMTSERFGGAELFNKWANIRNDIPAETVENTGAFKEIIGGDPIKAEEKYQDPFMFRPTAKHAFSANQLPDANTDDEAFFRRILLVPFPETVPKAERDPMLDEKLQDELSGILNWALEGLQRLLANGGFTGDRSPGRTRETWEKWGNSVDRFRKVALESGDESVPKSKVYAAYLEYCRQESMPSETQHLMTRSLKTEGFEDGRAYVDGSQERVFMNVAWTSRGEELLEQAQSRGDRGGDGDDSTPAAGGLSGFGE